MLIRNFSVSIVFATILLFTANAQVNHLVIGAVYGGGGNASATYKFDFIELYNPTAKSIILKNWSVQYSSAVSASWQAMVINTTIPAGKYYLIQLSGGAIGADLPTPDTIGTMNLSATKGKIALVNNGIALSGASVSGTSIIDLVGYGSTTSSYETAVAPAPSNIKSLERIDGGCTDKNDNSLDFITSATFVPLNSASAAKVCVGLPVVLQSFAAILTNSLIKLNWSTTSEIDFKYFIIQKSADLIHFTPVSTLYSNKITSGSSYSYIDDATSGTEYYRLKLVDNDGSYTLSSIIAISSNSFAKLSVFPNPVANTVHIYHPKATENSLIKVLTVEGKFISTIKVISGATQTSIDVSNLSKGTYLISLENGGSISVNRFIK